MVTVNLQDSQPPHPLRDINTIVLGDVADDVRGEFAGEGTDTHRSENGAACGEVTSEGAV